MSTQVQCPNCGGYKTETVKVEDVSVKENVTSDERKKNTISWLKAFPVYVAIALVLFFLGGIIKDTDPSGSMLCGTFSIVFILIAVFMIPYSMTRKTKKIRVGQIYSYYCYLCGYKWSWETGTPLPTVNVRPDLIASGEQRLEEEARQAQIANRVAQDILKRKP